MPVPLERWPELIWAQSALWVRRRRQTQNKANVDMYTTNSSPTIESLQDWVWRVLGTSFDVKVLLWWIFLSKFLCAYIDEPTCVHTTRFINSEVSNPADNGCNWTMVQQCNSSKILAKLLQQLLNRWLRHFHSRQVERFPNWQFIIKIETSLGPLLLHASVLRQAGSALSTPLWISLWWWKRGEALQEENDETKTTN